MFYGNSNGKPECKGQTRPFEGIPITVKVPTHVDIAIKEKIRFKVSMGSIQLLPTCKRHLFVDTSLVHTDKVFTVDVKRPAAGTLDYEVDFGDTEETKQYFDSIKSKIVDETIADTTTAISAVITAIRTDARAGDSPEQSGIIEEIRTVAWKRFDIDTPDFELAVSDFVDRHLNCCNSCQEYRATTCPIMEVAPMTEKVMLPYDPIIISKPVPFLPADIEQ